MQCNIIIIISLNALSAPTRITIQSKRAVDENGISRAVIIRFSLDVIGVIQLMVSMRIP